MNNFRDSRTYDSLKGLKNKSELKRRQAMFGQITNRWTEAGNGVRYVIAGMLLRTILSPLDQIQTALRLGQLVRYVAWRATVLIGEDEASVIAREHIAGKPAPADGYSFTLGRMTVVEPGWYFDYHIDCQLDIPADEQEQFGGPFGFLIDRESGHISIVSHADWVDLGLAFHDNPYGDSIANDKSKS